MHNYKVKIIQALYSLKTNSYIGNTWFQSDNYTGITQLQSHDTADITQFQVTHFAIAKLHS